MSFITQVTISIVIYFIIRVLYQQERSLDVSIFISALLYILIYLFTYEIISILPTIHFMVTGLSLLFIFIAYNEIIILERKVRKIKTGSLIGLEPFSVERNYKVVFKLLGIGLLFLSLALISGLSMQSIFTANIVFKAIFTFIAWLIFVVTVIGVKYFNFPIKYATRSLFIAMWAVLGAYFVNLYIAGS
jgi:ABC-type uncharacterized transport system permease subunit